MSSCPVCENSRYLLDEICPLCDGDPEFLNPDVGGEESSELGDDPSELFACYDGGRRIRVAGEASNAHFRAQFSVAKLNPPRFDAELCLGEQSGSIRISSLTADEAERIAQETASVPRAFPGPSLEVCQCILQVLGRAEIRHLPVTSSAASPGETLCLFFDELCGSQRDPKAYRELLRVTEVLPGVFRVHANSRLLCASLFMRPQQFYEDPDPEVRGRPRSRAELRARIKASGRPFDFYLRWPGFNLPSRVFDAFRSGALGELEPREEALVAAVERARAGSGSGDADFYVIGTCEDAEALHHEMAHGLYATNATYRRRVQYHLESLTQQQTAAMRRRLLDMGYPDDEDILSDEFQAYMAGGDELCNGVSAVRADIQQTFRFHANIHVTPYSSDF